MNNQFLQTLFPMLSDVVCALLMLILAFIVSAIAKSLVVKLLNKTRLKDWEAKAHAADGDTASSTQQEGLIDYIGKLTHLFVFFLFLPGIFGYLGVSNIADPISTLLHKVWGFLPNIIAAVIVLCAGTLVAKLVRELLVPLFRKLRVDKLQEKAGISVKDEARLSATLAYIVYVLIMIPVVIVALQALNISAITGPAVNMLNIVIAFIPNLIVALILIWVGCLIGRFTGQIVERLVGASGLDANVKSLLGEKGDKFTFSKTAGYIVQTVLDIFFVVEGVNVLKLEVLSGIGETVISYLPNVLACVLILVAAFFLSAAADKALSKGALKTYAAFAHALIYVIAGFMILNQLNIASEIVQTAFILILAALAVAFALSFGIGGRNFASEIMSDVKKKIDSGKEK